MNDTDYVEPLSSIMHAVLSWSTCTCPRHTLLLHACVMLRATLWLALQAVNLRLGFMNT
jgi:hypothetical protein